VIIKPTTIALTSPVENISSGKNLVASSFYNSTEIDITFKANLIGKAI
jgi:hypothetical protein